MEKHRNRLPHNPGHIADDFGTENRIIVPLRGLWAEEGSVSTHLPVVNGISDRFLAIDAETWYGVP